MLICLNHLHFIYVWRCIDHMFHIGLDIYTHYKWKFCMKFHLAFDFFNEKTTHKRSNPVYILLIYYKIK